MGPVTMTDGGESGRNVTVNWGLDLPLAVNWDRLRELAEGHTGVPHQTEPCGRLTNKGTPCGQTRNAQSVGFAGEVFLSPACGTHLTDEERQQRQAIVDRQEADSLARRLAATPACWDWALDDAVGEAASSEDETDAWNAFVDWHDYRCAICGGRNPTNPRVIDHDHSTGLIRGMLCRGCNVREGQSGDPIFRRYRQRNSATMIGYRAEYFDPYTYGLTQIVGP